MGTSSHLPGHHIGTVCRRQRTVYAPGFALQAFVRDVEFRVPVNAFSSVLKSALEHSLERDNDDEKQEEIQDFGKPLYISQN